MMHVNNYPYTFVGILLIFVGWFSIISGIFGSFRAEDLLIVTLRLETMFVDTTFVPEGHIILHMFLRIALGFFIVVIGNAFLTRGVHEHHHHLMHPRYEDFRRFR